MKTAYGHMLRRAMGAGLALMLASVVVACGGDSGEPDNVTPQFTSQATGAETTQEETDASGSSATSSASSTSAEPAASGAAESSSAAALRNDDGSYRLTNLEPGPGAPERIVASFGAMEDAGMKSLEVAIYTDNQNGVLQYPADDKKGIRLSWKAQGLNGSSHGTCRISDRLLDQDGVDQKRVYSGFMEPAQECEHTRDIVTEVTGEMNLELIIEQPGYDPVTILQPLLVV